MLSASCVWCGEFFNCAQIKTRFSTRNEKSFPIEIRQKVPSTWNPFFSSRLLLLGGRSKNFEFVKFSVVSSHFSPVVIIMGVWLEISYFHQKMGNFLHAPSGLKPTKLHNNVLNQSSGDFFSYKFYLIFFSCQFRFFLVSVVILLSTIIWNMKEFISLQQAIVIIVMSGSEHVTTPEKQFWAASKWMEF